MSNFDRDTADQLATWTAADVRAFWPSARAEAIVGMMAEELPYWRAVRRTRRYFLEGKTYAGN